MIKRTGLVWHERYMWHDTGSAVLMTPSLGLYQPGTHAENPETKRRLKNLLDGYDITHQLAMLTPRPASLEELTTVHTHDYVERVEKMSAQGGGDAGEAAIVGFGSYEIARLSAGGVIEAAQSVLRGDVRNAYALVRPPGHHALPHQGMGFCLFNNIAIAAKAMRTSHGVERIAIIDWDVHHGNGTEQIFYDDADTLTISIHCDRLYPWHTGAISDRGEGSGLGANVNIPLPPGSGWGAYQYAFERIIEPSINRFKPDMIIVACGFDACAFDPNGRMTLSSTHFGAMTERVVALADGLCDGRLLLTHEGGYSEGYVPFCGAASIDALRGLEPTIVDPLAHIVNAFPYQELTEWQEQAVAQAAQAAALV